MVSCQKGPTRHAYAWQIGPFWQNTLEMKSSLNIVQIILYFEIMKVIIGILSYPN